MNEASVVKHYINYAPIIEDSTDEAGKALEVLHLEKLTNGEDSVNFVSSIEVSSKKCDCETHEDDQYDTNNLTGCGIGSIYRNMTEIFKPDNGKSTFYVEEVSNCAEMRGLESKFSTLTPEVAAAKENGEYTKHIITKHKKHRSEIEINNCKPLNSSASSTVSSSTSIVIDKKLSELVNMNGQATFRSSEEVDSFFNSTNSNTTNEEERALESSDEYKLSSPYSSFESVDSEQIKAQIEQELPGQEIGYNMEKKKKGINIKRMKKLFRPNKDCLRLPPDI